MRPAAPRDRRRIVNADRTPPEDRGTEAAWTETRHPLARYSRLRSLTETVGATVAAAAIALLSTIVQARILGPVGRGEVVFLTVLCNMTAVFAMGGVQMAHSNVLSQEPEKARTVATNSVALALGLTLIVSPIAALILAFAGLKVQAQTGWMLTTVALIAVVVVVLHTYFRFLAIAQYRFRLANGALVVIPVTTLILNAVLGGLGVLTVESALLIWIGGYLIGLAMLVRWVFEDIGFGAWSASLAKRCLSFGLKNQLSATMQLANFRLDQMFVGGIGGSSALGVYSVAVAWSESLFYLPEAMSQVQRPDVSRAGRQSAASDAAQGLRLTFIATAVSVVAIVIAAPLLVDAVFGSAFSDATVQLRVLAFGAFGIATVKLLANLLNAQNRPLTTAMPVGVSLIIPVGLAILLLPSMEGLGAAIASSVAYSVGGLLIAVTAIRVFDIRARDLLPGRRDIVLLWSMLGNALRRPRPGASGEPE